MIDKPQKRGPLPSLMEEQFRVAMEAAPNAMLLIDQVGTIILVNAPVPPPTPGLSGRLLYQPPGSADGRGTRPLRAAQRRP
jgi:hypothetical protein